MPVNVKAGQHTVYWGDSLLLGGAIHGVSYAQNSLDLMEGLCARRARKRRSCSVPRGGITLQAQATKDLSIAGQWFYNWQAMRMPESGSYLTVQRRAAISAAIRLIFGANPFAAAIPGAPALPAPLAWNKTSSAAVALQREPGRLGRLGALEPGLARRHARLLLPQRDRHPAAGGG